MVHTTIVLLESEIPDSTSFDKGPSSFINVGTCFDFNTRQENLFIVGTEDGKVFEYSKEYNNRLTTFDAHLMPIYGNIELMKNKRKYLNPHLHRFFIRF